MFFKMRVVANLGLLGIPYGHFSPYETKEMIAVCKKMDLRPKEVAIAMAASKFLELSPKAYQLIESWIRSGDVRDSNRAISHSLLRCGYETYRMMK